MTSLSEATPDEQTRTGARTKAGAEKESCFLSLFSGEMTSWLYVLELIAVWGCLKSGMAPWLSQGGGLLWHAEKEQALEVGDSWEV